MLETKPALVVGGGADGRDKIAVGTVSRESVGLKRRDSTG